MRVTDHYLSDMIALQPCVSCLRFVHGHCFGLSAGTYTLTQLRYDLRKMKAHGLFGRIGRAYSSASVGRCQFAVPPPT